MSQEDLVRTSPSWDQRIVTPTDGVEVFLNGKSGKDQYCRAFIPNADGTLRYVNFLDRTVTLNVIEGQQYDFIVKQFMATGTSGVTSVLAIG